MKTRIFLKVALVAGLALALQSQAGFTGRQALDESAKSYRMGSKISAEAFVVDQTQTRHTLLSIIKANANAKLNVLFIFGGGAMDRKDKLGGIWCPDSFEDLQILRFIDTKYEQESVQIIPVACAPVYSTQYYGFAERVLLDEPDDSDIFQEVAKKFIASTQEAFIAGYIPVQPYFDLRHRLLMNHDEEYKPGQGYGKVFDWQGCFRAAHETQKYGVPSIWLLDSDGVVLAGPFHGNQYQSEPYQIKYTILDIDRAIAEHL